MIAYVPLPSFMPVSIADCELDCAHCKGKYLDGMTLIDSPHDFLTYTKTFKGHGILISGGFDTNGKLLNLEKMLPALQQMKNKFYMALHPGFVNRSTAKKIAQACHSVFIEIPSNGAIKNILGLPVKTEDYIENMKTLLDTDLKVSPHVTLGLHYGVVEENDVIDYLKKLEFEKLVINIVVPTTQTPFEKIRVNIDDVLTFVREIKKLSVPFAIGCMRPRYFDIPLLKLGVDEIANPSSTALTYAKQHNIPITKVNWCCGVSLDTIQKWEIQKKEYNN